MLKRRTTLCDVRRWESLQTIRSKQGSWNHGNVFTEPCRSSKEAATNPCNWGDEQIRCGSTHFRNGIQAGGSPEWLSRLLCHKSNMTLTGPGQMLGLPLSPNHAAFPSLGMHMKLVPYSHWGRSSGLESCNEGVCVSLSLYSNLGWQLFQPRDLPRTACSAREAMSLPQAVLAELPSLPKPVPPESQEKLREMGGIKIK